MGVFSPPGQHIGAVIICVGLYVKSFREGAGFIYKDLPFLRPFSLTFPSYGIHGPGHRGRSGSVGSYIGVADLDHRLHLNIGIGVNAVDGLHQQF